MVAGAALSGKGAAGSGLAFYVMPDLSLAYASLGAEVPVDVNADVIPFVAGPAARVAAKVAAPRLCLGLPTPCAVRISSAEGVIASSPLASPDVTR